MTLLLLLLLLLPLGHEPLLSFPFLSYCGWGGGAFDTYPLLNSVLHTTREGSTGTFQTFTVSIHFQSLYLVLNIAMLPQVPVDVVQEWLRAFQSAEALVLRQRSWILEV